MNPIESIKSSLKKYVTFHGRASRLEFLYFNLFAISLGLAIKYSYPNFFSGDVEGITGLYFWIIALPTFALVSRRLQDMNNSPLWLLLFAIEFLFSVVEKLTPLSDTAKIVRMIAAGLTMVITLYLFLKRGTKGENKYGSVPL